MAAVRQTAVQVAASIGGFQAWHDAPLSWRSPRSLRRCSCPRLPPPIASGLSVVATGGKTTPVTIGWTTTVDDVTQQAYRVAGPCPAVPAATDQISTPAPPPLGGATTITDTPPDGTWCYVVTTTGLTGGTVSGGVSVDRPSTGVVAVSGQHNPNYIRGTVNVTAANNADVGSGVASFVLLAGTGDCLTTGTQVGAGWTPGERRLQRL